MRKVLIVAAGAAAVAGCSRPADHHANRGPTEPGAAPANPSAAAGLLPRRRPGLWRMALDTSTGPGFSISGKMCVDASRASDFDVKPPTMNEKPECDKTKFRAITGGWSFQTKCRMKGRVMTTDGIITGDAWSRYHVETATRTDPPHAGMDVAKVSIDAAWDGPCPRGMKAGDLKLGGINLGG
jgi:hypothetical protein